MVAQNNQTMKAIKYLLTALVIAMTCSSCLMANLRELDTFKGNNITSAFAYYRYVDESITFSLSNSHAVKQAEFTVSNDIDADAGTCIITASLPSNFPADQVDKVSAKELVIAVQISAAAVIAPTAGSPALGTPADWSTPHKYIVTAANGDTKEWTITVILSK